MLPTRDLVLPTRDDVERARATLGTRLARTPLMSSRTLGARLKCELFQRTGSFKVRGALNKLTSLDAEQKARGVIAISAGNHAQAVAYAAAEEGVDALVVMWRGASEQKIEGTRGYGATVDLEASGPGDAFDRLDELIEETGRTLVHPFDDPVVIAGAGTVGLELLEDAPDTDAVIVPVGGGGLISGIQTAIGDRVRVVAVEPDTSTALHTGAERGEPTPVTPTSIADGLNAPFVGNLPLAICGDLERVLVSEDEIEHAFRLLYQRAKLACEPAGAAATAAWLARRIDAERPVLVVSGGNVAASTAAAILARP
ncbi:MAG TPA: threonine/serine dehydratase [Gaiellaceae bacterium]|nr:threonine/serine dehydratase [Gaiellaceae bacterium]